MFPMMVNLLLWTHFFYYVLVIIICIISFISVESLCALFILGQWNHFWVGYSKCQIWLWKFKVKAMAKVKPDGHIRGLGLNRYVCFLFHGNWTIFGRERGNSIFDLENSRFSLYVCFLFHGNQTIFGQDLVNSIFDLENSRSRSWPR